MEKNLLQQGTRSIASSIKASVQLQLRVGLNFSLGGRGSHVEKTARSYNRSCKVCNSGILRGVSSNVEDTRSSSWWWTCAKVSAEKLMIRLSIWGERSVTDARASINTRTALRIDWPQVRVSTRNDMRKGRSKQRSKLHGIAGHSGLTTTSTLHCPVVAGEVGTGRTVGWGVGGA